MAYQNNWICLQNYTNAKAGLITIIDTKYHYLVLLYQLLRKPV